MLNVDFPMRGTVLYVIILRGPHMKQIPLLSSDGRVSPCCSPTCFASRWGNSSRDATISAQTYSARKTQATANSSLDEIEQRLALVSAEVAALKFEAENKAITDRDKILAEANREGECVIEPSKQEIDRVVRIIEREIKENSADMVIDCGANSLRTQMTQDDQNRVVVRFIKKL